MLTAYKEFAHLCSSYCQMVALGQATYNSKSPFGLAPVALFDS